MEQNHPLEGTFSTSHNTRIMVSLNTARKLALSLPEVEEHSHFHLPDFRVKKKIFASLHEDKNLMMVKFNNIDQSVFCEIDPTVIYPVPGRWGKKGSTFINLKKIKNEMLIDAVTTAWKTVAPLSLVNKYFPGED